MTDAGRGPAFEDRVLEALLRKGILVRERLDGLRSDLAEAGAREPTAAALLIRLVQLGELTASQFEAVKREVGGGASEEPRADQPAFSGDRPPFSVSGIAPGASGVDGAAWGAEVRPEGPWERFQFAGRLGRGGTAEVFKAYDPRLRRFVALKVIRVTHPELTARLVREAQIQARVDHPNVCKVYEVGESGGLPYIAMQLVEGRTLDAAARELGLEQRVLLVKRVAEAVHAAHRLGLVHRDIKPANVLVEDREDQGPTPYVTDFGLAREMAMPGLTATGSISGTPNYMAPEQVKGDASSLDRRTDVHALGATLYELLSGRPPFEGDTALAVLVKVLADMPVPLRKANPSVPRDLATIVEKCLEKDPGRRYESAKSLADDLARFLDGEPVQARPVGWVNRLGKRLRKNRVLTAVSALSAAAVLVFAGLWLSASWRAAERARLARTFGSETERTLAILRFAHLAPLHDTRPERDLVAERIAFIRRETARLGRIAEGPGESAVGRAYLALHRYREARASLERAWGDGYRGPETAYALGLVLGALYQQELEQADRMASKDLREARKQELEREYRDPALRYLGQALDARTESPDYVKGLLALYDGRYDDAAGWARKAAAGFPWLYEARQLEGDALFRRGLSRRDRGDLQGGLGDLEAAGSAYRSALAVGRSDPSLYLAEGLRRTEEMSTLMMQGRPSSEAFQAALAACGEALRADPDSAQARDLVSRAYWVEGQRLMEAGQDPTQAFEAGIRSADEAAAVDPEDPESPLSKAYCLFRLGEYESRTAKDPRPRWEESVACCRKALAARPGHIYALNTIGLASWRRAEYEMGRGMDPLSSLDAAAAAFGEAMAVHPLYIFPINMGNVFLTRALFEMDQGKDPTQDLDRAVEAYGRGVALNPKIPQTYSNLASAYFKKGEYALGKGGDPTESLRRSVEYSRKAIELNPARAAPHYNLSTALLVQGVYAMKHGGQDPSRSFQEAREAAGKALELRGGYYDYVRRLGEIDVHAGRWAARSGGSPAPLFARAESLLAEAVRLNPRAPENYHTQADLYQAMAEWREGSGQPPRAEVKKGLAAADKALSLNPNWADLLALRASLYASAARLETDPARRSALAGKGSADARAALALNPALASDLADTEAALAATGSPGAEAPARRRPESSGRTRPSPER